jgi:hypothetical protein
VPTPPSPTLPPGMSPDNFDRLTGG